MILALRFRSINLVSICMQTYPQQNSTVTAAWTSVKLRQISVEGEQVEWMSST